MRARATATLAVWVLALLPAAAQLASPCAAHAAEAGVNRAGLVIEYGDLSTQEFCVSFTEESLTGLELLQRTGLPVLYQDYGAGSVTVCKIGGEGCDYPQRPCFCRCATLGACTFWGYYRIDRANGLWKFSQGGAGTMRVRDGDVDGWRWGEHGTQGLSPPPPSDLAGVCARGRHVEPAANARDEPAPQESPLAPPEEQAAASPSPLTFPDELAPEHAAPTETPVAQDAPRSDGAAAGARARDPERGTGARGWLAFVVLLGALAGIGRVLARRSRERAR